MTLDLDELERKAKAASPYRWGDYYPGQAPKELVDLRNAADSATVLALIERVRTLERLHQEVEDELEEARMGHGSADPAIERVRGLESAIINVRRERDDLYQATRDQREAFQVAKSELQERVRELERVANAVRSITKDVAEHDRGADCPYVSQEEARELLAIIDGVKSA